MEAGDGWKGIRRMCGRLQSVRGGCAVDQTTGRFEFGARRLGARLESL